VKTHLLTPEQAYERKQHDEIHRLAWKFRRATGGQLRLALLSFVPENLREPVEAQIQLIQKRHGIKEEH